MLCTGRVEPQHVYPGRSFLGCFCKQAIAQVCAVYSPPSWSRQGDFECNRDITPVDRMGRRCLIPSAIP
jgi:hypothetical protein